MADWEVIDRQEMNGTVVEVLGYKQLAGSSDANAAERLYFVQNAGMQIKMVRIQIEDSKVRIEPGSLYYMKGDLEMKASTGGGWAKSITRKFTSGENLLVNEVHGTGEIYLEPTLGHFLLATTDDEEYIVDKSLFCAGTENLDVSVAAQRNVSSALFGGEGLFQTKIAGSGIAVIFSPVPRHEIEEIEIDGKLSVDGNFAIMRTGGVDFRAEKSSKSWVSTSVSGEGLLQTFSGEGKVWIAPTQDVYAKLATQYGTYQLSMPPGVVPSQEDN